jgi:Tfp pilus assembly protein PilX
MNWARLSKTDERAGHGPEKKRKPLLSGKKGFALVAALMAIWLLTAVGVLVFTVSTQDIRISGRLVCEKRAFSAAETGLHWLTLNFKNEDPSVSAASNQRLDTSTDTPADPHDQYTIGPGSTGLGSTTGWYPTSGPANIWYAGFDNQWGRTVNTARVTGTNTACRSEVQIDAGVGYGPIYTPTTRR